MDKQLGDVLVWRPRETGSRYGQICVRYSYLDSQKPVCYTLFWPASDVVFDTDAFVMFPELENGGEVPVRGGNGVYGFTRSNYSSISVRLTNGGQTQAIGGVLQESVPAPKVRKGIETRWYQSGWQKYLKSQGWVCA